MVSHFGGPIILMKYVEQMEEYDANDIDVIKTCQDMAFSQLMAMTYIRNSDPSKYGLLVTGLKTQQSLGNDQYPTMVMEAMNILSNHHYDMTKKNNNNNNSNHHPNARDIEQEAPALSFAQLDGKCHCCGRARHMSNRCYQKHKPKSEWAITKAMQNEQQQQSHLNSQAGSNQANQSGSQSVTGSTSSNSNSNTGSNEDVDSTIPGWAGTQVQLCNANADDMKDWILLDNQSMASIFCNLQYVGDIKSEMTQLHLSMNGGGLCTNLMATIRDYPKHVWFDDRVITNIFAFHEMKDQY